MEDHEKIFEILNSPRKKQEIDRTDIEDAIYEGLVKVVNGGINGVERAALDAAILVHVEVGGIAPYNFMSTNDKGRAVPTPDLKQIYNLTENQSVRLEDRLASNVRESDATLIIDHTGIPVHSYEMTIAISAVQDTSTSVVIKDEKGRRITHDTPHKPYFALRVVRNPRNNFIEPLDKIGPENIADWIVENHITTLHVTGSSEFSCPGISAFTFAFFGGVLYELGF